MGEIQPYSGRSRHLQRSLRARRANSPGLLSNLAQLLLLSGGDVDPHVLAGLSAALKRLAADSPDEATDAGASLYFSRRAEHGVESVTYDYGANSKQDGTQPLGLLAHVGAKPLFFSVAQRKAFDADYRRFAGYLGAWLAFADRLLASNFTSDEVYERWSQSVKQLLRTADDISLQLLTRSLADGQIGLVVASQAYCGYCSDSPHQERSSGPELIERFAEASPIMGVAYIASDYLVIGSLRAYAGHSIAERPRALKGHDGQTNHNERRAQRNSTLAYGNDRQQNKKCSFQ